MKSFRIALVASCLLYFCHASAQIAGETASEESGKGQTPQEWKAYGEKITIEKTISFVDLLEESQLSLEEEVLVEGTISDVCQNKGCWITVTEGETTVRVEFKDHSFFVPWESKGKNVKIQGKVKHKTTSASSAKRMACGTKDSMTKTEEETRERQPAAVLIASCVVVEYGGEFSSEQREIIEGKKVKEDLKHMDHDH